MWLNHDSLAHSLIHAASTLEVRIHIHPLNSISRFTRKYSTPNLGENSQKTFSYSCFSLWNKCSRYFGYYHLLYYSRRMSALKKSEYEEIKRGKFPEPRRKSETRGKNRQVSNSRIRGTRYPPKRKEKKERKENIEHLIPLKKLQCARKVCIPQKSTSRIRLSPLLSPSSPYTIHLPHMHILIWLIDLFL